MTESPVLGKSKGCIIRRHGNCDSQAQHPTAKLSLSFTGGQNTARVDQGITKGDVCSENIFYSRRETLPAWFQPYNRLRLAEGFESLVEK